MSEEVNLYIEKETGSIVGATYSGRWWYVLYPNGIFMFFCEDNFEQSFELKDNDNER